MLEHKCALTILKGVQDPLLERSGRQHFGLALRPQVNPFGKPEYEACLLYLYLCFGTLSLVSHDDLS